MSAAFRILLILIGVSVYATPVEALDSRGWAFGIHFENDLFADTDQQYTNGIKLIAVTPDLRRAFDERRELPDWGRWLVERVPFLHGDEESADTERTLAFSLGQNIYTPQDTRSTDLVRDDRPYAGWLYFGTTFQVRKANRQDSFDVQMGIIGPYSFAEEAQELVHRIRDLAIPQGWDNQLRTEPGLVLAYERTWRLDVHGQRRGFAIDVLPRLGGALGNVATYASAGLQFRTGWNLPPDFGYSVIRPGGVTQVNALRDSGESGASQARRREGFSLYAFAGVDARLVAHDVFLDGNTFRDSHEVDSRPFVADLMAGITLGWRGAKLSLANVLRTREFRNQPRDHRFGSITLSYAF